MQGDRASTKAGFGDGGAAPFDGVKMRLRPIGTSDLHTNVFSYDYFRDKSDDTVGLAKTATLIRKAMSEVSNSLLFDNGDIIQGTPFGDYVALEMRLKKGDIHPMIAAMNTLPYEACTLGNHEFNYGLDFLDIALSGARFPAVSANILKPDGEHLYRPWIVLERSFQDDSGETRMLRVGVIGFSPPQITQWDESHLKGRAITVGIAEAARIEVPKMRAEGVDLVLAL